MPKGEKQAIILDNGGGVAIIREISDYFILFFLFETQFLYVVLVVLKLTM